MQSLRLSYKRFGASVRTFIIPQASLLQSPPPPTIIQGEELSRTHVTELSPETSSFLRLSRDCLAVNPAEVREEDETERRKERRLV